MFKQMVKEIITILYQVIRCVFVFFFINFSTKTYVVGTQKKPSQRDGSFEHPKHIFKVMGKKIMTILRLNILLILIYGNLEIVACGATKYMYARNQRNFISNQAGLTLPLSIVAFCY